MDKIKVIALIGPSACGKDTLLNQIIEKGNNVHRIVSYTTRPPRENEIEGVSYKFITDEEMQKLILKDKMYECSEFNNWIYGTGIDCFDKNKVNIGVYNIDGVYMLQDALNIDLTVYYIIASDKNRLLRQLRREENPNIEEILRRYRTDKIDFSNLDGIKFKALHNDSAEDFVNCLEYIFQDNSL